MRTHRMYESDIAEIQNEIPKWSKYPNPNLGQGQTLPIHYGVFSEHFCNIPMVDIDPYYRDKKTFLVISKVEGLSIVKNIITL